MNRSALITALIVSLLSVASGLAQMPPDSQGGGNIQDYFNVPPSSDTYLKMVELGHVRTVPKWITDGRLDSAMADIRYTLDRFPNHPVALQQLSVVAQMAKKISLGVSYYERAISLFPQYAITRAQYGLFLVSINQTDAGMEHLKRAIEMEPTLPSAYAGLARAYEKKGDLAQAREAAKKARELGFTGKLPDGM